MGEIYFWGCDPNFHFGVRYSLREPRITSAPRFEIIRRGEQKADLVNLVINTEHGEVVAKYNPHDDNVAISNCDRFAGAEDFESLLEVGNYVELANIGAGEISLFKNVMGAVRREYDRFISRRGKQDASAGN